VHEQQLIAVSEQIKKVMGRGVLRKLGDQSGFVIRQRTITAERFVPSLIKSLATHNIEAIADLLRDFNFDHGQAVHYKPYYNKLNTPCFPRMMMGVFESMLTTLSLRVLAPLRKGPFAGFTDILIQDGTSFAVHDALAEVFAGRFTKVSPAAVELHCTMSLYADNLVTVTLTGDAECERHYLPEPKELKGKLLMIDRGYDGTTYLMRVDEEGGSFIVRIRKSHNPMVINIYRRGERYRKLEGKQLSAVLRRLPRDKIFDMDVCWDDGTELRCFSRLVVGWNPTKKEWIRILTNLDREGFSAEDILQAYRLRWQIELLFKELKSYANLHKFSTTKPNIAEGLIWASLAAAFIKRYLAHACQRVLGLPISTRRVAMSGYHVVGIICDSVMQGLRDLVVRLRLVFEFLAHNAKRSNLRRERQRGRLALGIRPVGVAGAVS
jgi:hypothetical protein